MALVIDVEVANSPAFDVIEISCRLDCPLLAFVSARDRRRILRHRHDHSLRHALSRRQPWRATFLVGATENQDHRRQISECNLERPPKRERGRRIWARQSIYGEERSK